MIDKERLYARFMELCAIDSEPTRERLLADRLTELLSELGCTVTEDDTGEKIGGNAGNLIARLNGTGPGEPLPAAAPTPTFSTTGAFPRWSSVAVTKRSIPPKSGSRWISWPCWRSG